MSKKAKEIVDGKGSDRISAKITEFYEEKYLILKKVYKHLIYKKMMLEYFL